MKTVLVLFGVLAVSTAAQADRVVPEPHVTNNFVTEIQLASTTMEMYAALRRIVEERERGNTSSPDLAKYTQAFEKLAAYRAKLICTSAACIAQTVAEKDQALAKVNSLVALNPGDYRRNPSLYTNSYTAYKKVLQDLVNTWAVALDNANTQSKLASGSSRPAAESIGVEYLDGEARLTGVPSEETVAVVTTTETSSATTDTASSAF